MCQSELLSKIQKYSFAITELNLYLDTHPNCRRALAQFNNYKNIKRNLEQEYIDRFGPILAEENNSDSTWHWVSDPWPWERMV